MTYQLGVDLGTTFTAAAVTDGRAPTMVGLGNRSLEIPSVLYWTGTEFLVGEVAERRGLIDPARVARLFKRRLGDPVPILVGGSPFSAEALTARLLRWVVDRTSEQRGEPPAGLTLTHPANWGDFKLDILRQAVEIAEVGPAGWLPEPVAAAAQYASRTRVPTGSRLAVYDLGGGTLDVCVVEKRGEGFEILGSPEGIEHLGGSDFDEVVFQQVLRTLGDRMTEIDPDDPEVTVGLARLRRECVEAKEALSSDAEVSVPVALPGLTTTVRVSRNEFEALVRPALEGTFTTLGRVLRSAGLAPSDLTAIVLVGGSSRIPMVADLLQRNFEVGTAVDTHPKHDVVLGAMQVAHLRMQERALAPAPATAVNSPSAPDPVPPTAGATAGAGRRTGMPRRLVVASLVAAVGAGVAVGSAVHFRGQAGASDQPTSATSAPSTASAQPSASGSASPSVRPAALPRSTPLKNDQLIVPMKVKGNWDLYLADDDRSDPVRRLTRDDDAEYGQVLSPDRATMIYLRDRDVGDEQRPLWVAGADGKHARPLFATVPAECSGMMYRPAWSRVDPDQLAVPCTDTAGRWGLYLMRTDGTDVREVRQPGRAVDDPTFSPNGKQLAFWSGSDPDWDGGNLYLATLDGKTKQLTSSKIAGRDADPTWSPDGKTIVFRRRVVDGTSGGNADIYRVPANGSSEPTPLAQSSADEQDPSFSESGREIAYKSAEPTWVWPGPAVPRVWVMNKDGSNKHVLWTRDAPDQQTAPAWSGR